MKTFMHTNGCCRLLKIVMDEYMLFMYRVTIEAGKPHPQSPQKTTTAPLLSELYIQIPKPQPTKKIAQPYADAPEQWEPRTLQIDSPTQKTNDSHCFIFSGTRTKNSSASLPYKSESQIISEWVRNLFQKRGLLGPHWQVKLSQKRKELVLSCFQSLKEYEPKQQSAYLQTQSRYKPQVRKINQLLALGIEKLVETIPRLKLRQEQEAFSKILRYLAFQHMKTPITPNSLARSHSNSNLSNSNSISLKSSKNTLSPRLLPNVYSPSREDYELDQKNAISQQQLRTVQSSKHIPIIVENEYALAPFCKGKEEELIRSPRDSRGLRPEIGIHPAQRVLVNSKYMQESQHSNSHRIQISNKNDYRPGLPFGDNQPRFGNNPPSPTQHQFSPLSTPHFIFTQPPTTHPNHHNPHQVDPVRNSVHLRPHTHNPFSNRSVPKEGSSQQSIQQEKVPESRSRAVSASPNIKISFMATNKAKNMQNQGVRNKIPNDYEGQHNLKVQKVFKLGTAENRQMRQSYQLTSWDNQLVPQDYPRSPCTPFYSSPITPKVLHSPPDRRLQFSPNVALSPAYEPASPNSVKITVGRPSPRTHREPEFRGYQRPEANDYNFKRREKITVTASSRKRQH